MLKEQKKEDKIIEEEEKSLIEEQKENQHKIKADIVDKALNFDKSENFEKCISKNLRISSNEGLRKACGEFIDEKDKAEVILILKKINIKKI